MANCNNAVECIQPPLYQPPGSFFWSVRFGLGLLGFLGLLNVYALRVNLSVALVCMVNNTALLTASNHSSQQLAITAATECERGATISLNDTSAKEGEFAWDKSTQGLLLGSFFWGYLSSQILGGLAAQRYGTKRVFGYTVFIGCIATFLTPAAAQLSYHALIALRIVLGICQGVTFPCMHNLWSRWAPPLERSKLTGITYAGAQVGNVLTLPVAGILCDYGFAGGWPSVFYVLGIFSFLFFCLWMMFVSDRPEDHRRITSAERMYIIDSLKGQVADSQDENRGHSVPWRHILTSMPVWACIVTHWSADWAAYSMLTSLPTFMKEVLGFELSSLGFLASIPYIAYFVCINFAGFLADLIQRKQLLNTGRTRKLMQIIALVSQAVFQVAAGYCGCGQEMLVIALLTLGLGLSGFQYAGHVVNYMDIAPQYSGTILGIGNSLACVSGILAPFAMGLLTPNKTRYEWLRLFWLTAAILVAGTIFYVLFASGEVQPWAQVPQKQPDATELLPVKKAKQRQEEDENNDEDDATPEKLSKADDARESKA